MPYIVIYLNCAAISPRELQDWLNQQYLDGLKLISTAGYYFIFEDMRLKKANKR